MSMTFDPFDEDAGQHEQHHSDYRVDDNDLLTLDAWCTEGDHRHRIRSYTDSILSTPERKRKRLELRHFYIASRHQISLALTSTAHFFNKVAHYLHLPHIISLPRRLFLRRRHRQNDVTAKLPQDQMDHMAIGEQVSQEEDLMMIEKDEDMLITPRIDNSAQELITKTNSEQIISHQSKHESNDDETIRVPASLELEEAFRARKQRSQSTQHVRCQSMQEQRFPITPPATSRNRRYQRSQSMNHVHTCTRSASLPSLIEEDTVLCGDQILHARYRDSHEPSPFSAGPPSPEILGGRIKKHQPQRSFDAGYGNTLHYQTGPVRKAMSEFRSLENPSCEEYLEQKFRRQNIVLEEIRCKMPKAPPNPFKRNADLKRSSGYLT